MRRSSYLYSSILLSLFIWRDAVRGDWHLTVQTYLPPVLGFSFAALAIMTAIGDDQFRKKMAQVETISEGESDLTTITANFCWFIVIQICAVMLAIIFKSKPIPYICHYATIPDFCDEALRYTNYAIGFLGNFLMTYSLLLIVAAVSQMMNVFRLYLRSVTPKK